MQLRGYFLVSRFVQRKLKSNFTFMRSTSLWYSVVFFSFFSPVLVSYLFIWFTIICCDTSLSIVIHIHKGIYLFTDERVNWRQDLRRSGVIVVKDPFFLSYFCHHHLRSLLFIIVIHHLLLKPNGDLSTRYLRKHYFSFLSYYQQSHSAAKGICAVYLFCRSLFLWSGVDQRFHPQPLLPRGHTSSQSIDNAWGLTLWSLNVLGLNSAKMSTLILGCKQRLTV